MSSLSIMLIGGPDSGKTNYLGRLWKALQSGVCRLKSVDSPEIKYVEEALAHLLSGTFAPRTDLALEEHSRDFAVTVSNQSGSTSIEFSVPDVTGELWKDAVNLSELPVGWMEQLKQSRGALLFVRVHSKLNVSPLDWVTARELLKMDWAEDPEQEGNVPTQVALCELLRFLQLSLQRGSAGELPRVAIAVTAWDRLDDEKKAAGPKAFLENEYPLFAGKLEDIADVEVKAFGISIVGGDLAEDKEFRAKFFEQDLNQSGYVVEDTVNGAAEIPDLTLPLAWLAHE
jgi:hypothetical protein